MHTRVFTLNSSRFAGAALVGALALALAGCATSSAPTGNPSVIRQPYLPTAEEREWITRYEFALYHGSDADEVRALQELATRWPLSLRMLSDQSIAHTALLSARNHPAEQFTLLRALFDADYMPHSGYDSGLWELLGLDYLERGDTDAAAQVLRHVTTPWQVIDIRVDKRFAPVRAELGEHALDVDAAMAADIARMRTLRAREPDMLAPLIWLDYLLLADHQAAEVLRDVQATYARIQSAKAHRRAAFIDQGTLQSWLLQMRADALWDLGLYEEAIEQLEAARRTSEARGRNVSQTINLAERYNDLGNPRKALATLALLPDAFVSPYGRLQIGLETLRAAIQMNDRSQVDSNLRYLRHHAADSTRTLQEALLLAGELPEARQLLVSRLNDPRQRRDALLEVQSFHDYPSLPRIQAQRARWEALIAYPDVQAAIARVGAVETFDITAP